MPLWFLCWIFRKFKVHIFWEDHKFCETFNLLLTGTTYDKSKVKISQILMAFSKYMNFKFSQKCRVRYSWKHSKRILTQRLHNSCQLRFGGQASWDEKEMGIENCKFFRINLSTVQALKCFGMTNFISKTYSQMLLALILKLKTDKSRKYRKKPVSSYNTLLKKCPF